MTNLIDRAGRRESLCRFRFSLRRRLSARRMGGWRGPPWFSPPLESSATPHDKVSIGNDSCFSHAHLPHFSWPNRTTYVSVMPGRGGLRYVSLRYLSRSLIGLTIARVRMWISLAFLEGFHRVHVCDRIDADTGREREVRSVQVPLHFFFAIVLCMVGLKWGIHIITQRWAGSSPPWNPTEARVNYAAQGMAAVRRNLFTMPLAIYAYVWTSTYVLYMYIFSSLGNPASRPHMSTFLVWLRRP